METIIKQTAVRMTQIPPFMHQKSLRSIRYVDSALDLELSTHKAELYLKFLDSIILEQLKITSEK